MHHYFDFWIKKLSCVISCNIVFNLSRQFKTDFQNENLTNIKFSTWQPHPPQKTSYDIVNGFEILFSSKDFSHVGRSEQGDIGIPTKSIVPNHNSSPLLTEQVLS